MHDTHFLLVSVVPWGACVNTEFILLLRLKEHKVTLCSKLGSKVSLKVLFSNTGLSSHPQHFSGSKLTFIS